MNIQGVGQGHGLVWCAQEMIRQQNSFYYI